MKRLKQSMDSRGELSTARPFIDFYGALDISPVKQDISDLERHFMRRDSLYRFLGIPASAVRGAHVIEFGPGSGYNALHTANLGPARYTVVDGNPRAITDMRELFAAHGVDAGIDIVESLIENVDVRADYDLVIAEGLIAFQLDPAAFAQRIAHFAKPGGIVILTCSDAVSVLGDVGRRLIAQRSAPPQMALEQRMDILRKLFTPHLATLEGMSRPVDDWILDNIIQPWSKRKLFSISEAINCLAPHFDVYGSSPRFFTDWRWYKQVVGSERQFNSHALRDYEELLINFLDYRFTPDRHSAELGRALLTECQACYDLMQEGEAGADVISEVVARFGTIVSLIAPIQIETARSIEALSRYLAAALPQESALEMFAEFFGRGMQYVSFIRRR